MAGRRRELQPVARSAEGSPPSLRDLLGPPPLLDGEDPLAYEALRSRIFDAAAPDGIIEEIFVEDIVALVWETARLRRLKVAMMRSSAHLGLQEVLKPLAEHMVWAYLPARWAKREPAAVKQVNDLLEKAGLNQDAIAAQTFLFKIDRLDQIERMLMQNEARRVEAFREIDRHRDSLARRSRKAIAEVEEAEFSEVEPEVKRS